MDPAWLLVATLALASGFGLLWRRRDGRTRDLPDDGERLSPAELDALGVALGEQATLVQFSSAFCQPCRATRRVLTEVAGLVPGVAYAEVDAEAHLDAVRRLNILRTPTTLVLDRAGRVAVRASGLPRKADVIAALGRVVTP